MPTWADQLGWGEEGRTSLGRWPPNSEIPNRYDRAVCNTELRSRNEIIQKCQIGWKALPAFALQQKKKQNGNAEESSSADSASAIDSSDREVNIADLEDNEGSLSVYA